MKICGKYQGKRLGCALMGVGMTALSACVPITTPEDRTMDGSANNPDDSGMGQALTQLMRMTPVTYSDGVSSPAGENRPNARAVSNAVCAQTESIPNTRGLSDWAWQWGQFLDHDISLSEFMIPEEPFNISVPAGDPFFDPEGTGTQEIGLLRTVYDPSTGTNNDNPRQQMNQLTSYIDGSNVYGSDDDRAEWLRTLEGGRLKTSEGNFLPFNDGTQGNAGPGGLPDMDTALFVAGDIRVNEQSGLTSVHTLFMREHNRFADELAAANPDWTDEQIYQRTRKFVGAFLQNITYREFLPALLGSDAPSADDVTYNRAIDARIANVFANACYRIGHSMLSTQILRLNPDGSPIEEGPLALRDAFFDPSRVLEEGGIEPLLYGLASQSMQEIDTFVVDDVRNFLFGSPGSGGVDLASLNIQRGRDHGLPDYNTVREMFGFDRVTSFDQISSNPVVVSGLKSVYDSVDDIDPWIGGIAEDHLPDSSLGELISAVLADQFTRLRDGDRFWYAHDSAFSLDDIETIESTRLSDIIRRNTDIADIQDNVFFVVE